LKVWRGELCSDIYVTDYSENRYLEHRFVADEGPLGRRTLKITLWDGPNTMAEVLEACDLYLLKNVRLKKRDTSGRCLEGSMGYQDRGIHKIGQGSTQENLQELLMQVFCFPSNSN
jgi:hypothetical protein